MSSLRLPLDEPLSPELALVCPELAERARLLLPEPGWLSAAVKTETTARLSPLETLLLGFACVLMTVTPLVLIMIAISSQH